MKEYFVLIESWAVYIKDGTFFRSQGGLTEKWGKNWIPIQAESLEHAYIIGRKMRDERKEQERN